MKTDKILLIFVSKQFNLQQYFKKSKMLQQIKFIVFILTLAIFSGCRDDDPKPFKQTVFLKINHTWKDSSLVLNKQYYWDRSFRIDTISINNLQYHINNLRIKTTDSLIVDAQEQYYIFDFTQNKAFPQDIKFVTSLEGKKYYVCSLEFTIGVADSATNINNGLKSIFADAMYSDSIKGYINYSLQGFSPSAKELKYNIGGYITPYKNSRTIKISFTKPFLLNRFNELIIKADIFKFFKSKNQIDIETLNNVEKPNNDSKMIADNIARIFSIESIK